MYENNDWCRKGDYEGKDRKSIIKIITIYIMGLLYITVGVKHFIDTDFFMTIVPPYITFKKEVVLISGLIEISLGLLCFAIALYNFGCVNLILS